MKCCCNRRLMLLGVALLLLGCGRSIRSRDEDDRSLPLVQRARAAEAAGNIDGAAALYREALAADPEAARAHLDLAFLLHDTLKNYVGAIYHYRGYLRLRPETAKADMIRDRIRLAEQTFAARVLPQDREKGRALRRLEKEVSALRKRVGALKAENLARERQVARQKAASGSARTTESPTMRNMESASEVPGPRVTEYVVQPGDTLSKIAIRVYGDAARWHDILEMNRGTLGNGDLVKVGQRLNVAKEE